MFKDRIHVIDCLPNVWMVDGLLVTSKFKFILREKNFLFKFILLKKAAERNEVANFFQDSSLTQRPIVNTLKIHLKHSMS